MEIVIPTFALIIIGFVVYSAWVDKQRDEVEFKKKRLELHEWERTIKDKGWDEDYYEEELKWEAETGTSIEGLEKELRRHKEETENE